MDGPGVAFTVKGEGWRVALWGSGDVGTATISFVDGRVVTVGGEGSSEQ